MIAAESGNPTDDSTAACPGLNPAAEWDQVDALRGEIYGPDRLEQHAAELARSLGALSMAVPAGRLLKRIAAARTTIGRAYAALSTHAQARRRATPAEEWLLDNSHIVSEQLREIEEDLPWGYLRKLPRLANGSMKGYPRAYGLCLDYLRHTDARLDPDTLVRYVNSFQTVSPLAIGELWAIAIFLRLGLILTTGAIAAGDVDALTQARGEKIASRLGGSDASVIDTSVDPSAVEDRPSLEQETRRRHVRQAADQVTVGNAITSMRTIAALDWNKFFERTSLVEKILQGDPGSVYATTDESSRDRYRHVVEEIAEGSKKDERDVAAAALTLAETAARDAPGQPFLAHVGYYLVGEGRPKLEAETGHVRSTKARAVATILRRPGAFYFGIIGALSFTAWAAWARDVVRHDVPLVVALAAVCFAFVPITEVVIALVNALAVSLLPPRVLPKLSLRHGIGAARRTLVVVPVLVDNEKTLDDLLARLEVRALANSDDDLHFALLTDFPDASMEERPGEAELLSSAKAGIAKLNASQAGSHGTRFFLFHRRRLWNPSQGVWMGWERKRGKLNELNRLIRGASVESTTFSIVTAPLDLLRTVKFVITLDADTELPRDTARKLVSTIAHPLNRARWDADGQLVGGYGVIQPRVGTLPRSSRRSRFARITAGPPGIDPYTTAISDVYQDLFASGSYVGKGIYAVEAFDGALAGRVPENRMLSHDLFEGIFARAALASDIELLDDQPSSYAAVAARQHRWIRGDFQLIPWLFPWVPTAGGGTARSDLPPLGWWKLFDNLRRAVTTPSLVALALIGWFSGRSLAPMVTAAVCIFLTAPLYGRLASSLFRAPGKGARALVPIISDLWTSVEQLFLTAIFLFDHAIVVADAIVRTSYRSLVSKKKLLEWQTAGQAERSFAGKVPLRMWIVAALSAVVACFVGALAPRALGFAVPFLALWLTAPGWALLLAGREARYRPVTLSEADTAFLRRLAIKTWRFFETFVGEEDHFLPPDNFQEDPLGVVAHRTSPTNIGLYLLSILAARDFGLLTLHQVRERLGQTLSTMANLQKHEGHILNWFDTTTLKPLEPAYVSTVDSGNLAAYLWTLREACLEFLRVPIVHEQVLEATAEMVRLGRREMGRRATTAAETALADRLAEVRRAEGRRSIGKHLSEVETIWNAVERVRTEWAPREGDMKCGYWLERARSGIQSAADEVRALAPWASRIVAAPSSISRGELAAEWEQLTAMLGEADSVSRIVELGGKAIATIDRLAHRAANLATLTDASRQTALAFLGEVRSDLVKSTAACRELATSLEGLGDQARALADGMNFTFLYDEDRLLFSIGYNMQSGRLDRSYYDLLASEARLASFVAIAKGDVELEHWFRLGRSLAGLRDGRALWSWSGSMFEYLMPLLVTRDGDETLLHETHLAVVETQKRYGATEKIPWGISESLFNLMDLSMTYQYRAFGVPGLGLKRDLDEDLVITPYATALAAMVHPDWAIANFRALEEEGLDGRYGMYEAIDYTPSRLPPGRRSVLVKAFMTHHQGMSFVALDNVLLGSSMQRRFHADPRVKATELLLEERVPVSAPIAELRPALVPVPVSEVIEPEVVERVLLDGGVAPRAQVLGQGDVSTIVTSLGTGVTTWRGLDVSRFREDGTLRSGGVFVYVRDKKTGQVWSAGYEPTRKVPDAYTASFFADHVEIRRRDGEIETVLEVVVSPESPAEVRRITLVNHGLSRRDLEITTYTEIALATRNAFRAHPAFSGMFVETEAVFPDGALIAHRRRRGEDETESWVVQLLTTEEGVWTDIDYDGSRAAFIGRGRDAANPAALDGASVLSRSVGAVLDPAFALRRSISLRGGKSARLALTTALGTDRTAVERLLRQYSDPASMRRTFELGRADLRVQLIHLGIGSEDGALFQRLFSAFVFPNPRLRSGGGIEVEGGRGRGALWSFGISGDLPILVYRVDDADFTGLGGELLRAHEFLRLNGFAMDLVLLDEEPTGYLHPREDLARDLVRGSIARDSLDRPGGIFVLRAERMSGADRTLLFRAAHVVLSASKGSLSRQLRRANDRDHLPGRFTPADRPRSEAPVHPPRPTLEFDNGIGGFDASSSEYVVIVGPNRRPPAPWCNVIANASNFGFVVSESGGGFTWSVNSQMLRLTPWSNDPISDPVGEVVFVRDDETGEAWSATPAPAGGSAEYTVRHGFGYTTFEHERSGLRHVLVEFVDRDHPVKIARLTIENRGSEPRRLRVYGAVEWVLGGVRDRSALTVATEWDRSVSTMFATNPLGVHPGRCSFFKASPDASSFTADRAEFFGRSGSRAHPAALDRSSLSGRAGAGFDPCAAVEVHLDVEPGETKEVFFVLGDAGSPKEAHDLTVQFADSNAVARSFDAARAFWKELLGAVHVKTPDPAFDKLLNGWLLYQVASCRFFARTGFYQSSGAYGFRDQLQDVMALLHARPEIARDHLLRAAARQFTEGDVQHWWHADTGEGIRTRCSDDMLWLPFVTAEYVRTTGDSGVLDESVPFLDDKPLDAKDTELFGKPSVSTESAALYEHCVRAIEVAITSGPHGLPRMRGGDWNDGMNRVGKRDGGESIWLAWFLARTLRDFSAVATLRLDRARADRWLAEADRIARATEASGWDGEWYRRGYFADGAPLGSRKSDDCHVDAIAQSWAVISGVADPERALRALNASEALLLDERARIMSLLWPPFQATEHDPGYIRAYPPGIRENGGQYTHGVLWTVLARALLGQGERAASLFSLLNPIHHGSRATMNRYAVEPYVLAGDVCAGSGKAGRGGWTWYTGAAGWMYRIGLENILGVRREGGHLVIAPCVPKEFVRYEIEYRYGSSTYHIVVDNPYGVSSGVASVTLDGAPRREPRIALGDDGKRHEVHLKLGATTLVQGTPGPATPGPAFREDSTAGTANRTTARFG